MGREAHSVRSVRPSASDDPVVRREALRSIGKLKERAPLDARAVLPLLIDGASDPDPGVRDASRPPIWASSTKEASNAVEALIAGLKDPEADVRRSSATALGSFGTRCGVGTAGATESRRGSRS